jgi:CRISPR-associated endoribonuclease Cas6
VLHYTGNHRISSFIHNGGVSLDRKQYRMFTFSRLWIPQRVIEGSSIKIISKEIRFIFSTPSQVIWDAFYDGLLKTRTFFIGNALFRITAGEDRAQPYMGYRARFFTISPVALSKKQTVRGISPARPARPYGASAGAKRVKQTYLLPNDLYFKHFLKKNLENKFIAHHLAKGDALYKYRNSKYRSPIERIYIRGSPTTKLITIKEGKKGQTRIPCSYFEFEIVAHSSVIEFAYDAGIGKHNSLGFGCLDLI